MNKFTNGLRVNFKIYTSQTGKQIIKTRILPNISSSKGNQTMESGQFIEDNMTELFS